MNTRKDGRAQSGRTENVQKIRKIWSELPKDEIFNEHAIKYFHSMQSIEFDYFYNKIAKLQVDGRRALDAGCGVGTYGFILSQFFDSVDGCDITPGRIAIGQAKARDLGVSNLNLVEGNILNLPYEDASFDFVFCYGVLISQVPIEIALKEMFRVLKPGGKIYVCLNGKGWSYYLRDQRSEDGVKYKTMGETGLYNTIIKQRAEFERDSMYKYLKESALRFSWARYALNIAPIYTLGACRLDLLSDTAKLISEECGNFYVKTFVADLKRLLNDGPAKFRYSHWNAGRGYYPEQIGNLLDSIGYQNYNWAQEERLNSSVEDTFSRGHLLNGELTTWEFMAERPA